MEESSPQCPEAGRGSWGGARQAGLRCPPLTHSHAKSSLSQAAFFVGPPRQCSQSGVERSEKVV